MQGESEWQVAFATCFFSGILDSLVRPTKILNPACHCLYTRLGVNCIWHPTTPVLSRDSQMQARFKWPLAQAQGKFKCRQVQMHLFFANAGQLQLGRNWNTIAIEKTRANVYFLAAKYSISAQLAHNRSSYVLTKHQMNVATQFTFSVYVYVSILSFEYVEMPMVTFSKVHIEKKYRCHLDSNHQPWDPRSSALPLSYRWLWKKTIIIYKM